MSDGTPVMGWLEIDEPSVAECGFVWRVGS